MLFVSNLNITKLCLCFVWKLQCLLQICWGKYSSRITKKIPYLWIERMVMCKGGKTSTSIQKILSQSAKKSLFIRNMRNILFFKNVYIFLEWVLFDAPVLLSQLSYNLSESEKVTPLNISQIKLYSTWIE